MDGSELEENCVGVQADRGSTAAGGGRAHDSQERQRSERVQRLKRAIATSLFTKPLAMIIPFLAVPLFLRYLGPERYGLYATVAALCVYLSMTNLGLGLGLMNKLTDCHVAGARALARRYVSTIVVALIGMALAAAGLWSVVTGVVDWRAIFEVKDPVAIAETEWLVWTTGVVAIARIVSTLPISIYSGYQELHRSNLWDGAGKILTLVACFAVVFTPWGAVGVVLALTGTPMVVGLVNGFYMFGREKRWLRPQLGLFDKKLLGAMVRQGIGFFILQLSVPAIFQSGVLIIAIVIEPGAVTEYVVLGQLYLIVYGCFCLLLVPLWPAHGEALRRGDVAWAKKMLRLSLLAGSVK